MHVTGKLIALVWLIHNLGKPQFSRHFDTNRANR